MCAAVMVQLDEARKQLDARQKTRAREETRLKSALTCLEAQAAADAQQVVSAQQAHEELLRDLPAYLSPAAETHHQATTLAPKCNVGQPSPAKAVHRLATSVPAPTPAAHPSHKNTAPKLVLPHTMHALAPQHNVSGASAKAAGMIPVSMAPKDTSASARQTTSTQAGWQTAGLQQVSASVRQPGAAVEQSAQGACLPQGAYSIQWRAAASAQSQAQGPAQAQSQARAQAQAQAALLQSIAVAQRCSEPLLNQYTLSSLPGQTGCPSAGRSSGPAPAVATAGLARTQKRAAAPAEVHRRLLSTGANTLQQRVMTQQEGLVSQQMALRPQKRTSTMTKQPSGLPLSCNRTAPALHAVQKAAAPSAFVLAQHSASAPPAPVSGPPAYPLRGQATTPLTPVGGQQRLSAVSLTRATCSEVLTTQPASSQTEPGPQACTHPSYVQAPTGPLAAMAGPVGHGFSLAVHSGCVEGPGRQVLAAAHAMGQTSVAQRGALGSLPEGAAAAQASLVGAFVAHGSGAQGSSHQPSVPQTPSSKLCDSQNLQASLSKSAALETQTQCQHHTDSKLAACVSPQLQVPASSGLPAELLALFNQSAACTPQAQCLKSLHKVPSNGLSGVQRASPSCQSRGLQNFVPPLRKSQAVRPLTSSLTLPQQQASLPHTANMPEAAVPSPLSLPPSNIQSTCMLNTKAQPDCCALGRQQANVPQLSGLY